MDRRLSRCLVLLGVILYVLLLETVYVQVVSPLYAYMGYLNQSVPWYVTLLNWSLAVVPGTWLPIVIARPSQVVNWILYLLVYVPALLIPSRALGFNPNTQFGFSAVLFFSFWILNKMSRMPLLKTGQLKLPQILLRYLLATLFIGGMMAVLVVFRGNFRLVGLSEVYELRTEFKDTLDNGSPIMAYVVSWQTNAFLPFLIAYGIGTRSRVWIVAGLLGQLVIYATAGYKSALFSVLLLVGLMVAQRKQGRYFGPAMIWATGGLVLVCFLCYEVFGLIDPISLFVRRLMITPGLLTGFYHDFFSSNPKAELGHSILSWLVSYPYPLPPPTLIGLMYFGSSSTAANANFWADGFANFGYLGSIGFTVLLGLILWIYDSLSKGKDILLTCLVLGVPALALSNSALLTSLLTHGLASTLLLVFILPSPTEEKPSTSRVVLPS